MSITWFAFALGHSANAAQPRNSSATSSWLHGMAWAPLAKIRPAGDGMFILQRDLNNGRHLRRRVR